MKHLSNRLKKVEHTQKNNVLQLVGGGLWIFGIGVAVFIAMVIAISWWLIEESGKAWRELKRGTRHESHN